MSRQQPRDEVPGAGHDQDQGADDQALADLLRSVREIRTTLTIDLAAAAGALEAKRPEIARDIVSATADEVASIATDTPPRRPVTARRGGRRALLALPAIPLLGAIAMTTAAALGGSGSSTTPPRDSSQAAAVAHQSVAAVRLSSSSAAHDAAATTLHRLEHVVSHDPRAAQVLAVAADLHQQLTAMIATSTDDPARLHVVRQLLILEQRVLETSKVPGTQLALAASREITRLLEHTPQTKRDARSLATHATPTDAAVPRPTATSSHSSTVVPQHQPAAPNRATNTQTATATPGSKFFGKGVFGRR